MKRPDSQVSARKAPGEVRWFSRQGRVENGVFLEVGVLYQAEGGSVTPILPISDIALPGIHNVENYMAAFAAVRGLVSAETMDAVARSFHGVEHRIERDFHNCFNTPRTNCLRTRHHPEKRCDGDPS